MTHGLEIIRKGRAERCHGRCAGIYRRAKSDGEHGCINPKTHDPEEMEIDTIKFDVAVSVGTKTLGGAEGGLEVFSVKLGTTGGREHEATNVSRIEFTLGVAWPHTHVLDAKKIVRAE